MNNRHILAATGLLIVVLLGASTHLWITSSNSPDDPRGLPEEVDLKFHGTVTNGDGITVDGNLTIDIHGIDRDGFPNVSLRLYDAEGSLLDASCVGSVAKGERKSIDYTSDATPKYVVFDAPSMWTEDEENPTIVDYYEYDDGEYLVRSALRPSSYPVDVTRHDPCA